MSPALLAKYLAAARQVAEHLVLRPQGITIAPHPVMTETDRDKYCVNRIVAFYRRQPTDYADYFRAAWRFQHRAALGEPQATLAEIAAAEKVSPKYLAAVWAALAESPEEVGPLAQLQAQWRALPAPRGDHAGEVAAACQRMRDFVVALRKKLEIPVKNLEAREIHKGSQPLVLWKNRQYAAHRRAFSRDALVPAGSERAAAEPDLVVPADPRERARYEAAFARFASLFPDAFYVAERGRDYLGKPREQQEKGRLLSAGFHSMMGYFRDDGPLVDLVLSDAERAELDLLWQELDFITSAPMRQHSGFVWFERTDSRFMRDPEFDFARAEDKDVTSEEKIGRLAAVYLAKARATGSSPQVLEAIEYHFHEINAKIRWVESARRAAEPSHLEALVELAARAYRRPLTAAERESLLAFYRSLRAGGDLSHEEAVQDTLVSILLSPHFCYRMDLAAEGPDVRPLGDYELASRLSYFLWSSLPDRELLDAAAAGKLHEPAVLVAQARRMLQDERSRALAVEFGGNWLDFRRFEEHNSVDRHRFPQFTNELRQAMFEEPVRFFVDLVRRDGSVLDFLYARHTFVNGPLAEHYGITGLSLAPGQWQRVEAADAVGRGGLLPMAVFQTYNAPGLRTSPVKRGYWVVRRLLGERIPAPPPNVPELPSDEAQLGDLTLREVLARHRDHASCAGCHERFDAIGLVFEGYGPIGERRERDLGGRPVETVATFPDGSTGQGLAGLQSYLKARREQDFLDNLSRKLLSYALERSLLPSDEPTLDEMRQKLAADGHRFSVLIESIVTSPQFLTKRGAPPPSKEPTP
jgi:hypothetical protein